MIVSYFDIFIVLMITTLNVILWKKKISFFKKIILITTIAIIFPILSIALEFSNVKSDETFDAFTMAYTFLKLPMYWIVALIQLVFLFF